MSQILEDPSKSSWTYRRRVVFGTLIFIGLALTYLIALAPDDDLRSAIATGLIVLAGTTISGYVFGATWDDSNYMKSIGAKKLELEAAAPVVPAPTPPDSRYAAMSE